jgi:hypothetical protein
MRCLAGKRGFWGLDKKFPNRELASQGEKTPGKFPFWEGFENKVGEGEGTF